MSESNACEHRAKVYAPVALTSMPAKRPWVCRECGSTGLDVESTYDLGGDYRRALEDWRRRREDDTHGR